MPAVILFTDRDGNEVGTCPECGSIVAGSGACSNCAVSRVSRARSAIGQGTRYKLGAGGRDPETLHPGKLCDCTGYLAWVLGTPRRVPDTIGWIETSRIVRDAQVEQLLFRQVETPEPGDVVVYGDKGGRQGHCGLVTQVEPLRVVHCSSGNYRKTGDAIQETAWRLGGIFARFSPR